MVGERIKQARIAAGMSRSDVAYKLGVSKLFISQLEDDEADTENIVGDLFGALSYLYQVPLFKPIRGVDKETDYLTKEEIISCILDLDSITWNARGVLINTFWYEELVLPKEKSRNITGSADYEQKKSAIKELLARNLIYKQQTLDGVEVYHINYLCLCEHVRFRKHAIVSSANSRGRKRTLVK